MKEIKCPKCGTTFAIDEAEYASIVKQVRDQEFATELHAAQTAKENEIKLAVADAKNELGKELSARDTEIVKLKAKLESGETAKKLAITEALDAQSKTIAEKDTELTNLRNQLENSALEKKLAEKTIAEKYEIELKAKDDQIALYKDFKAKLSTKGIGESLEKHCQIEFNKLRATAFKNAYFEKDNKISDESLSKGDFIFRDYSDDGQEYVSIMFEMKNEADETATKHKNEDFFKELDKDRKEKHCEYAVLVSLLEQDNDLYNQGIVDVSYQYDKMYVIRPQFFIPMITILRNAALNSLAYQRELAIVKAQQIDVTNFENKMNEFKDKFAKQCGFASKKFEDAINDIDKTIKMLQKIRDELVSSGDHLRLANERAEDLSIKKLTWGNPTMKAKFEEAENINEVEFDYD